MDPKELNINSNKNITNLSAIVTVAIFLDSFDMESHVATFECHKDFFNPRIGWDMKDVCPIAIREERIKYGVLRKVEVVTKNNRLYYACIVKSFSGGSMW